MIVLAGEMLAIGEQFLEEQMHPTVLISAYRQALEDMIVALEEYVRYTFEHLCVRINIVVSIFEDCK